MHQEIGELRIELHQEIGKVRAELHEQLGLVRSETALAISSRTRVLVLSLVASNATLAALAFAAARLA